METTKKRSLAEILAEKKLASQQIQQTQEELDEIEENLKPLPSNEELDKINNSSKAEGPTGLNAQASNSPIPNNNASQQENKPAAKLTLQEILAAKQKERLEKNNPFVQFMKEVEQIEAKVDTTSTSEEILPPIEYTKTVIAEKLEETFSLSISLNEKQLLAKELAFAGKSFCLIGAAGTGKTTAQREIASELLRQNKLGTHTFRIQGTGDYATAPSVAFVAYTRVATGNLRRAIHKDPKLEEALQYNITTIHNLLEYYPEFYWDYEKDKESMRFVPKRNANNPLDITHLIIEEASMVDVAVLWDKLYEALKPGVQIIFIGDINQLPPVFGASILNYALIQLPVVELTQVYRQKEGSSILDNAHKILAGKTDLIEDANFVIMRNGDKQHGQFKMSQMLGSVLPKWHDAGEYDPEQDIILSPWNKQELGTDNLNRWIAQHLGTKRGAVVHEVIAGMNKHYLAVGDKVMYNKQTGIITAIARNWDYKGKEPLPPNKNLTRFGSYIASEEDLENGEDFELSGYENLDLDKLLEEDTGEKKREASHTVTLLIEDTIEVSLSAVGDYAASVFSLGYCLTVHKAQGCEWRKVFFILHKDHAISAFRELFYTAVTRAREKMVVIAKDFMVQKAINTQRIKGNTLTEKIEYFNSGAIQTDCTVSCTKNF